MNKETAAEISALYDYFNSIPTVPQELKTPVVFMQRLDKLMDNLRAVHPDATYRQVLYVLSYAVEVKKVAVTALGIVPYLWGEAKAHCESRREMLKQINAPHECIKQTVLFRDTEDERSFSEKLYDKEVFGDGIV